MLVMVLNDKIKSPPTKHHHQGGATRSPHQPNYASLYNKLMETVSKAKSKMAPLSHKSAVPKIIAAPEEERLKQQKDQLDLLTKQYH